MAFIYLWTNTIDGKKCLGRHSGSESGTYVGSGKYFRRAYLKYGRECFERIILERVDNVDAEDREQYYLDLFDAAASPEFYNISPNAHGGHNGRDLSGEKNGMYGKTHPNHRPHFGSSNGMFGSARFGASNPNSKAMEIISPTGEVFQTPCLKLWCQQNQKLFNIDWTKVYQTFRDRLMKKQTGAASRGNCKNWSVMYVRI